MEGSNTRLILEYLAVPVGKQAGESEVKAIERIILAHAEKGFELVEACGDEIRMPNLIFAKTLTSGKKPELKVEEIAHVKGKGEIDEIRSRLLELNDQGWFPLSVLDSPLTPPIAIYKKVERAPAVERIEVVPIAISLLGQKARAIKDEILSQEMRNNLRPRTVMSSGLTPVVIFVSREKRAMEEYLVEHAKGGIFSKASKRLTDLIRGRSLEGWQVCGAFEDETLMPCLVFSRHTDKASTGA
ncbi:MAG: hypothetical protein C5B53_07155 [Candidatus Melainabacteria bacterium]|nr:MAG: hypothetical protein C5B53_07155 [Candidatus Melainabacteria bacterium]